MTFKKKFVRVKKDFDMNSASSCVFHHSQWEACIETEHYSLPYLMYRIIFMLTLVFSMTFSTLCESYLFEIFLTNWSFTIQTVYATIFTTNIIWKKRYFLLHSIRLRFKQSPIPVYSESTRNYTTTNVKSYKLKETKSWGDEVEGDSDLTKNNCVNINIDVIDAANCCNPVDGDHDNSVLTNPTSVSDLTTTTASFKKCEEDDITFTYTNNNNNKNYDGDHAFPNHATRPSFLEKVIWILMNVAHVLPHIVALGYWLFVYKYDPDQPSCERFRSHFIVHGATSVLAFVDSLVVAVPARKTHFIFPSFVLLIYSAFSYIYEIAGGPYRPGKEFIYSILNWRYKPERTAMIVIIGLILSPLVHLVLCWGMHHIRIKLVSWSKRNKNRE